MFKGIRRFTALEGGGMMVAEKGFDIITLPQGSSVHTYTLSDFNKTNQAMYSVKALSQNGANLMMNSMTPGDDFSKNGTYDTAATWQGVQLKGTDHIVGKFNAISIKRDSVMNTIVKIIWGED